jgi:hypothetical protein
LSSAAGAQPQPAALPGSFQHWLECCQLVGALGGASLESLRLLSDQRLLRERWLATLSHDLDRYLRSSAFLEMMGLNVKLMALSMRLVLRPSRQ